MGSRLAKPVVVRPARRSVAVAAALSAVVVGILAVHYTGFDGPGRWDALMTDVVDDGLSPYSEQLRQAARLLTPVAVACASVLIAVIGIIGGRFRLAIVAALGPALTGAATTILQALVDRTLNGTAALPSGHTAVATALATVAVLVWTGTTHRSPGIVAAIGVAVVVAGGVSMALALVVGGLHVPTDTIAGFCTAVTVVLTLALAVDRIAEWPGPCADRPADG